MSAMQYNVTELKGKFIGNMIFAFGAQMISLLVSLLLSLVVPKFLVVEEFAYWQLFIFYTNYVNIAQLGIVDGIYLKLGGKNFDDLDHSLLKAKYRVFTIVQIIFGLLIISVAYLFANDRSKVVVFSGVAVYLVVYNLSRYLGFIFQAVNNTRWYSISSMIDRFTILILGIIVIATRSISWKWLIIIYIFGVAISLIYSWYKGKVIISAQQRVCFPQTLSEIKSDATIGISLMISNLASMLILGCGRQTIEWYWGLETFGRVSFALSMTNFFLLFINQVSLVMFPALRKVEMNESKNIFMKVDYGFSLISPLVYILYIPVSIVLKNWLPQYESSLSYLMLFMPVCVFDGKMQMLYNTYLKVLRKEKLLLKINLFCVALSILNCLVSVLVFDSFKILLAGLVIVIAIRSLVSSYFLSKVLAFKNNKCFLFDLVFAVAFVLLSLTLKNQYAVIVLLSLFVSFLYSQKQRIRAVFKKE